MVTMQTEPATRCVCQAVVYVTLVVTNLLQLKQVMVVGSLPTAGGITTPTETPGSAGIWPSGWGYTPGAVVFRYAYGPPCGIGCPTCVSAFGGTTNPYGWLPTTAEYGGGRSLWPGADGSLGPLGTGWRMCGFCAIVFTAVYFTIYAIAAYDSQKNSNDWTWRTKTSRSSITLWRHH